MERAEGVLCTLCTPQMMIAAYLVPPPERAAGGVAKYVAIKFLRELCPPNHQVMSRSPEPRIPRPSYNPQSSRV